MEGLDWFWIGLVTRACEQCKGKLRSVNTGNQLDRSGTASFIIMNIIHKITIVTKLFPNQNKISQYHDETKSYPHNRCHCVYKYTVGSKVT
jgi:hypothetical protein